MFARMAAKTRVEFEGRFTTSSSVAIRDRKSFAVIGIAVLIGASRTLRQPGAALKAR
jgi:hypothetical protein